MMCFQAYLDQYGITPGTKTIAGGHLDNLASYGLALEYLANDPSAFTARLAQFPDVYTLAVAEVDALEWPEITSYAKALMHNAL